MRTFNVSDVPVRQETLHRGYLLESLERKLGRPLEAVVSGLEAAATSYYHPLVDATSLAFRMHLPLTLSPDDIWLCVMQGLGQHVSLNAEALRDRWVSHGGQHRIVVRRDEFIRGSPDNDWAGVFSEFAARVQERTTPLSRELVADFSTSGPVERAASRIALLSVVQSYFDYTMMTLCGIPSITLLGTVEDWCAIRVRVERLQGMGLDPWLNALRPVLDEFVSAARGDENRRFWKSFFKLDEGSGGRPVTGWINVLFPYIKMSDRHGVVTNSGALTPNSYAYRWQGGASRELSRAPTEAQFGSGLASAPLIWNYLGETIDFEMMGGFVGISQDSATSAVRPAIGWAVGEIRKPKAPAKSYPTIRRRRATSTAPTHAARSQPLLLEWRGPAPGADQEGADSSQDV